jgi:hypothetical protein
VTLLLLWHEDSVIFLLDYDLYLKRKYEHHKTHHKNHHKVCSKNITATDIMTVETLNNVIHCYIGTTGIRKSSCLSRLELCMITVCINNRLTSLGHAARERAHVFFRCLGPFLSDSSL